MQLSEVDANVSDPTGTHSLGYSLAKRTIQPLKSSTDPFRRAASQQ